METQLCSIHNVQMPKRTNEKGSWFSHKLPDGKWCRGEEKDQLVTTSTKPTPIETFDVSKSADIGKTDGVWDAKDRLSARQTAWNVVSHIVAAQEGMGAHVSWPETEAMVKSVYEDLISAKNDHSTS